MKVWQLDKKDVVPICKECYELFKNEDVFENIGDSNYRGFNDSRYRYEWNDQNFCFFCFIYHKKEGDD